MKAVNGRRLRQSLAEIERSGQSTNTLKTAPSTAQGRCESLAPKVGANEAVIMEWLKCNGIAHGQAQANTTQSAEGISKRYVIFNSIYLHAERNRDDSQYPERR